MATLELAAPPGAEPRTDATRIRLCGPLYVEIAGRRVDGALRGAKGRLLLAYLILARGRAATRDELIDALWPSEAPNDPDAAFSTVLTRTRQAVGHDVILGRAELVIALPGDAWVDWEYMHTGVADAERSLAGGDAETALRLAAEVAEIARQPLLSGLSTPWVEDRRRTPVELYADAIELAAQAALALGAARLPLAERNARELVGREPYREAAYALLMEVHAARGNHAQALRVYDDLRRLLRDELGIAPSAPLRELAARLLDRHGEDPGPPRATPTANRGAPARVVPATLGPPPAVPLVGRGLELHRLLRACGAARESGARVALVTGEPGIGKSRLLAELARHPGAGDFQLLHGRADRDAALPYQSFVEAVRTRLAQAPGLKLEPALQPELAEVATLVPELRATVSAAAHQCDPGTGRHRLFEGFRAILAALLDRGPVLLVLDDLQWADRSTLLLLRHLVRSFHAAPLLVAATARDDEAIAADLRALLVDLWRLRALDRVPLGGLDAGGTAALVAAHRPGGAATCARDIWRESGGNPFLVEELASQSRSRDLAAGVRDFVDCRLQRLPEPARRLLAIAASSGDAFDAAELAEHAAMPLEPVLDALAAARAAGLLEEGPGTTGRFAFRSALDRRAVLAAPLAVAARLRRPGT